MLNTQGKEDGNTRLNKEKQFKKKSLTMKEGGKRQCQEESL